jgi:flagellar protein FliS
MESILDQQTAGDSLDRIQVVSMLYDGAINFTRIAKKKMETGDSTGKSLYIRKTSAIVKEMSNSINMDGGEIAQNLRKLYDYVLTSLLKADTQNDLSALDDAEKVIEILRNAWSEMQEAPKY